MSHLFSIDPNRLSTSQLGYSDRLGRPPHCSRSYTLSPYPDYCRSTPWICGVSQEERKPDPRRSPQIDGRTFFNQRSPGTSLPCEEKDKLIQTTYRLFSVLYLSGRPLTWGSPCRTRFPVLEVYSACGNKDPRCHVWDTACRK